jgi:hypothetical protein
MAQALPPPGDGGGGGSGGGRGGVQMDFGFESNGATQQRGGAGSDVLLAEVVAAGSGSTSALY